MPITCICPQCQKTLAIGEEYANQPMRCPLCMALFQAPPLQPAMAPMPAPAAPRPEAAPPWAGQQQVPQTAPANGPQVPYGPVWGGIGDGRVRAGDSAGPAWNGTVTPAGGKVDSSWHMVRRGLDIIPTSAFVVFLVLLGSRIFLLFADLPRNVTDIVQLVSVPLSIIATIMALLGMAMCCLVPEPGARKLALGAAGCLAAFLLVGLLTLAATSLMAPGLKPGEKPTVSAALGVLVPLSFVPAVLLLLVSAVLFLLFLRAVALHLGNKRQAWSVLYCAAFIGSTPLLFLLSIGLLWMTSRSIGGDGSGFAILVGFLAFLLILVDLFWFLWVARDVRRTVLRQMVAMAT